MVTATALDFNDVTDGRKRLPKMYSAFPFVLIFFHISLPANHLPTPPPPTLHPHDCLFIYACAGVCLLCEYVMRPRVMAGSIEDDVEAEAEAVAEAEGALYTFAYASKILLVASFRNNNNNNNNFSLHLLRKSKMSFVCRCETGAGADWMPPWLRACWPLMGFLWALPLFEALNFNELATLRMRNLCSQR